MAGGDTFAGPVACSSASAGRVTSGSPGGPAYPACQTTASRCPFGSILSGERVGHRSIGKQQQLVFGSLCNMGCIEVNETGQFQPSGQLRLALPDLA